MEKPKRSGASNRSKEPSSTKPVSRKKTPAPKKAAPATASSTPAQSPLPVPPRSQTQAPPAPKARARTTPPPQQPAPPILQEGDASPAVTPAGPGARYVLGPTAEPSRKQQPPELPTAYGTQRLLLVARDPHWLYAHWDLTEAQRREYNRRALDGHLCLRIHRGSADGEVVVQQDVHPESLNWFIHVPDAGARYTGELGYVGQGRVWNRISVSSATLTPSDALSSETWARFETLPFEISMPHLVQLVREAARHHAPLLEALRELRASGHPGLPPLPRKAPDLRWTPAQEQALAAVISMDEVRRVWIGSLEITELLRRQLEHGISSAEIARSEAEAGSTSSGLSSLSSPFGGSAARKRGFWFKVNAEVIVYGATDPAATVRVGDRTIQLRPDGTFSFRFSLPDGSYPLPIQATSPDGVETRRADLRFQRDTKYEGSVGKHPQDPALRPPSPDHVR